MRSENDYWLASHLKSINAENDQSTFIRDFIEEEGM